MNQPGRAAYQAIILAGGRGSRLGGLDKGSLVVDGRTLLANALHATRDAARTVVVGDGPVPDGILLTREQPAYAGPAAAVVAGLRALRPGVHESSGVAADFTVLLACDLAHAQDAVDALLRAWQPDEPVDGWCLLDADRRLQWLCGLYRTAALERAAADFGDPVNRSLGSLLRQLSLAGLPTGAGLTADIDTPEDLQRALELD